MCHVRALDFPLTEGLFVKGICSVSSGRILDVDFRGNDSPKAILANINAQFSTNRVGDPCYCCEISAFAALLVKEGLAGAARLTVIRSHHRANC
jgi:hypothetical protein